MQSKVMHQIEKLELTGFKSFCDRTDIKFNEGITAIVGPNGCGKSNLADAISWVVGEQSAKSLRTDRMEGVIFNGTQARKATGMAEVTLSLRLSANFRIPEDLELNPEGFTVGRRLYRSGESEYLLDGRRCRLRDIQALFEGTGLGPNSYALIEQGRIGQILSSKPADRRSLIEEAARITLFKSRRTSAELKLELAQQNLLRVNDIVREVVRQLNSLKRQAAKARRYGRLREELRNLHRLKIGMEHRVLGAKLEECRARLLSAQQSEGVLLAELARVEESRQKGQDQYRRKEDQVRGSRESLAALKVDLERATGLRDHQGSQKADLETRLRDVERDTQAAKERWSLVEREHERLETVLQDLQEEIAREEHALESEQARSELLLGAIRETEAKTDEVRSLLLNEAGELADLKNLQIRCREHLDRIQAQAGRLELERETKAQERTDLWGRLDEFRLRDRTSTARREEIARLLAGAEADDAGLKQSLEALAAEITALQEEHSLAQHRYSSLEEVERRRTNYSEGVQKFLSTQVPGEAKRAAQTLADHVETDPQYESAVEDYLNEPLQYILVDGMQDAVESVERLRRIGAGKCTFLTIRNGGANGHTSERLRLAGDGIIGYLDDLLRMRDDIRHAFERALPEYASTLVVADLPTAFRLGENNPSANFLTLSGESYAPRGTLSAVGERKSMAGFLALKREKRDLQVKLDALGSKLRGSREEFERLKKEQARVVEAIKGYVAESRKLEVDAIELRHEGGRLEGEIEKLDRNESVATVELSQLRTERLELEARLQQTEAAMREIEQRSRSGEEELRALAIRLESLRAESAASSKSLARMLSDRAVSVERKASCESDLRRLAAEGEEVRKRLELLGLEHADIQNRLLNLDRARRETALQIEELGRTLQGLERGLEKGEKELEALRESLESQESRLRELYGERELAMEARGRVEIERTRLESDLEHLERSCEEEFHVALSQIVAQIAERDWQRDYEGVCRQHDELRGRVENFGAINMRALEEYQEHDQRYQFLNKQRADIEQSIADTQKAIAEINRRSIDQFQDAFTKIRENFMDVFQILFKGGQCDLRLLDESDVLESGIDIIAQPPGKRLQNVLLLSGGEKALTALALLIAIFRFRPSPFCVLDEVDAPLDDANITRFTQLITELSKETQFILITHNKRTMEIAQTLYGVTMEEPGVSKIVGVDFRDQRVALAS